MSTKKQFIIAGIGTDIGKTVVSAILCQAYQANYWKPIQAGSLENTDNDHIERLVSYPNFICLPETYRLNSAMSPHAAALRDDIEITREVLALSSSAILGQHDKLIIELAGGLMVPLSNNYLNIDFIEALALPVILVVKDYLGSINHTLLSVALLKARNIPLTGLIFNGEANPESREFILKYTQATCLAEVPHAQHLNSKFIQNYAQKI